MTGWTPDVSQTTIIVNGLVQGAGLGFLFVPLSTVTLGTLPPEQRTEGAGLYNLSRNIGSSVGISVVTSLLTESTQANHDIVAHVTAVNRLFESPTIAQFWNRRFQDVDDRDARRNPAAHRLQEGVRRWR